MLFALAGKLRLAATKLKCYVSSVTCADAPCCGANRNTSGEHGDCCAGVLHEPGAQGTQDTCATGQVYLRWGALDGCCGCLPDQVADGRAEGGLSSTVDVQDDLCCPLHPQGTLLPFDVNTGVEIGCMGRCCRDGICTDEYQVTCEETGGVWHPGQCLGCGCPADCCDEDSTGNVTCETIDCGEACVAPRTLADPDCATGCLGQCCIDGEPQGMMTQAACEAMDGLWQGLGVEDCSPCACREPFDCSCCESVTSTAAGITFVQPRNKRKSPFADTFRVTVTGRTDSSIYVHGVPIGASCNFEVTFLLCGESFNIEPVECGANFKKLDVKVCWEEEHTSGETLEIRGCETGTIAAGSCRPDGCNGSGDCPAGSVCTTTLLHDETGAETDADIQVNGRLTIDSSGTGPLVLTGDLTVPATSCSLTIVITGTNDGLNRLDGDIIQSDTSKLVLVEKRGEGTWKVSGANQHTGELRVLDGTYIVGADVGSGSSVPGPFGKSAIPVVGSTVGGGSGVASLLLAGGVTVGRDVAVASLDTGTQVVALGGHDGVSDFFPSQITLGRDVTLQAASGATCTFNNQWTSAAIRTITFGSAGNAGTVVLSQGLGYDWPVIVAAGTARMGTSDVISSSPVTVGGGTLDLNGTSQEVPSLTFTTGPGTVSSGTLKLGYSGTADVTVTGTGHTLSSAVTLNLDATITVNTSASLTIAGVVSGSHGMTIDGGGTLTLSAANTYSGTTTINGGTAIAGDPAAFGTGPIVVNSGGTLNKGGHTLANTITNNGGTVIP